MSVLNRLSAAGRGIIAAASAGASRVARARRAPTHTIIQQWRPLVTSTWSIEQVLNALTQHESGNLSASGMLVAAFGRDDRISACRNTRVKALIGRNGPAFEIKPAEVSNRQRANKAALECKKMWWSAFPEPVTARILGEGIDLGVSISRIHQNYDKKRGTWLPTLETWDPQHINWRDDLGHYTVNTTDGVVSAIPGTGEWFVYEPGGRHGWMTGAVRAMGLPFLFRGFTHRDWARYCERHGNPILAITEPAAEAVKGQKESFYKRLRNLGKEGIIRLPQDKDGKVGFDVKVVEPVDKSWQAFEGFLGKVDVNIAIYYLGQNLSTEVQGGSYGAAKSQNHVRLDYLGADAESFSTAAREQVEMPWGRFNFDWWDDEFAPWGTWDTAPPEDMGAKAKTFSGFATAVDILTRPAATAAFAADGVKLDLKKLSETFDVDVTQLTPEQQAKIAAEAEEDDRDRDSNGEDDATDESQSSDDPSEATR